MLLWFTGLLLLATPFVDSQQRFRLELSPDWQFTPMPGEVHAVHFRKDDDNLSAFVAISTMTFPEPVSAGAFAASIAAASVNEPGFRLLESGKIACGTEICLRRRFVVFVQGNEQHPKTVEEWTLMRGDRGFVLHGESLSIAFPLFSREMAAMFGSFQPIAAAELEQNQRSQLRRRQPVRLIGSWYSKGNRLELSPGGIVRWNNHRGNYKLSQGNLLLHLESGSIVLRYDLQDGRLYLSGGPFEQETIFQRSPPTETIAP